MPTVVNPLVVVLGVSPGDSPNPAEADAAGELASYDPPTVGTPHPKIFYQDTKGYWNKTRQLFTFFIQQQCPALAVDDCLALAGHLNLGTKQKGKADFFTVEPEVIRWVPQVLSRLKPKLIVAFGLNGIFKQAAFQRLWGDKFLPIQWDAPDAVQTLDGYGYSFRVWKTKREDGGDVALLSWPNHPSRHPFMGRENEIWTASLAASVQALAAAGAEWS